MADWGEQIAVVTGASRGIGRATAHLLAAKGAAVCVNYATRAEAADAVVREIREAGGREKERRLAERAMMGRVGEPEDVAHAVAFLAAPESGWITAQVLTVDGGRMDYIGHA